MDNTKLLGLTNPGDQKFPVPVRDWDAQRRALWRSRHSWEIAMREATSLIARCAHMEGCAAKTDEGLSCLPDCPDRELRMSALVILNAARQFAPLDARRQADGPYYSPSRERFSEVMAELAAYQMEIEMLDPDGSRRLALRTTSTDPELVTTLAAPQLSAQEETP